LIASPMGFGAVAALLIQLAFERGVAGVGGRFGWRCGRRMGVPHHKNVAAGSKLLDESRAVQLLRACRTGKGQHKPKRHRHNCT
jgi:hypothetical protein